ncbi:MAG TPA: hypothetical protein VHP58_00025 [Alphaproteobacteria bacterium]|nr:hypothetical protein [Alphaproteobacteria bacterium]
MAVPKSLLIDKQQVLESFAKIYLPRHESIKAAKWFRQYLVKKFDSSGYSNHYVRQKLQGCRLLAGYPCQLVGCPECDRLRRIRIARKYTRLFEALRVDAYQLYFPGIVPADTFIPAGDLGSCDWLVRRVAYRNQLKTAFNGLDVCGLFGVDIDWRQGGWGLHLHGVMAIRGRHGNVSSYLYRRITERLVESFNPYYQDAAVPVRKKDIYNLPEALTYLHKSKFSVAGNGWKQQGIELGKREVELRIFLAGISPRKRLLKIGF